MIESRYWKEELQRIATLLTRTKKPAKWSERSHCVLEREVMVGFFLLRRLIELPKMSNAIRKKQLKVYSYTAKGKSVTRLNGHDLEEMYDLEKEIEETKTPMYISNQFIHSYTSFIARDETRNWSDVFIVSDFDRNDCIWRVPVEVIRELFLESARDSVDTLIMKWDPKKKDYNFETN